MINETQIKSVLITGIAGSGGSYLAEHILHYHPDVQIHGTVRWHSTTSSKNLSKILTEVKIHECDLNDFGTTFSVLKRVKPDVIFHLASHANVRAGFTTPLSVINNNVMLTANLFEAIRLAEIDPVIQLCSTSEVYGQVAPENVPIREDCPVQPSSPYAVSKLTQDMLGLAYFRSYKMKVIRTRMFAYLNPRRTDLFATSFARQIARIEQGLQKELLHGNLDSIRTLIDVRDAMQAYWDAAVYCEYGEAYNIGGLTTISVGEFLEMLKGNSTVPIPSRVDPQLLRPADVTLQIPCTDKFTQLTGWKPQYDFKESVEYLLSYWRKEVLKEVAEDDI